MPGPHRNCDAPPTFRTLLALLLILGTLSVPRFASAQAAPDRVLVGYWHNWTFPNSLPLAALPDAYDVINVSFAVPSTPFGSSMTFSPDSQIYPNPADFVTDLQLLQSRGKKVLISVGGATGPVHLENASDVATFVASMLSIIATYGFDGLDIDLEGSSLSIVPGDTDFANPTSPRVVNFITAVTQILGALPDAFMLTAAPETATLQGAYSAYGGVWGAYLPVIHALRHDLDWVQVQHYNTGSMFGRDGVLYSPATTDFHVAMADMLLSGFFVPSAGINFAPLAPDQVVIGLPASNLAAGSGFTSTSAVHDALDHLYLGIPAGSYALGNLDGFPDFRGVMTWSINWDVDSAEVFSQNHRTYLDGVNLFADTHQIVSSSGGSIQFQLRAGIAHAGRAFFLVPTLSGTTPGTGLPGNRFFPINLDSVSLWPFQAPTDALFPGFAGVLDFQGDAAATLNVPPTMATVTQDAHFAFILSYPWEFYSPAIAVNFVP